MDGLYFDNAVKVGKGVGSKYDTEIHLSGTYKEFFSIWIEC